MQKNFIRNTIKCNCTPAKIRYNVLLRARLPQHSTDTGTRDSTATSAPHLISIQKPKMCHLIFPYCWRGAGACLYHTTNLYPFLCKSTIGKKRKFFFRNCFTVIQNFK